MTIPPLAGEPAPAGTPTDPARLERDYYDRRPDVDDADQLVSFGTRGHRGSPTAGTFTEAHVLAIAQAVCDYRRGRGVDGPLFMGRDTYCLSGPAERTVLEVLAGNGVRTVIQRDDGATPAPVISRAILVHNRAGTDYLADGIVVTPSHDLPGAGRLKYSPPTGGPAGADAARWIEERANDYLLRDNAGVRRLPFAVALRAATTRQDDLVAPYVDDLRTVVDLEVVRGAGLKLGVDPAGGAGLPYWRAVANTYGLDLTVVDDRPDPGVARHGVVTPPAGLPGHGHYLAVAVDYLLGHRLGWPAGAAVGKSVVTTGMVDRVARRAGRGVCEVPVGFEWFAPGLFDGSVCFGGQECAGATFLRHDGSPWTTDPDGFLMGLLAAEITARTGKDPGEHYRELTVEFGNPCSTLTEIPTTPGQAARLRKLSPDAVTAAALAGEPVTARWTRAPGNDAPIGGVKVMSAGGWFAARPSGAGDLVRIYAESFVGPDHLNAIMDEAQRIVAEVLTGVVP